CSLISNIVPLEIPRMGGILPATGQTESYNKFDDGFYLAGCNKGYTDNNDGTITDNCTGLMWIKHGLGLGANNGTTTTWDNAIDFCNNLDFAGYTDWRLPNYKELFSIVDFGTQSAPVINKNYFGVKPDRYWTSSVWKEHREYPGPVYYVYTIDFSNGKTYRVNIKDEPLTDFYILPVRGPDGPDVLPVTNTNQYRQGDDGDWQKGCNLEIQINEDGTKTDPCTNLMWQHVQLDGAYCSWEKAVEYAENSDFAGYRDWRLPNIQELLLTDSVRYRGLSHAWDYWSSTAYYFDNNQHWYLGNYVKRGETKTSNQNHFSFHWDIRLLFVRNIDD
ncbi:hypothetical protein AMJ49_04285, partial [Parcubacteria bacterium DG_74_2]